MVAATTCCCPEFFRSPHAVCPVTQNVPATFGNRSRSLTRSWDESQAAAVEKPLTRVTRCCGLTMRKRRECCTSG